MFAISSTKKRDLSTWAFKIQIKLLILQPKDAPGIVLAARFAKIINPKVTHMKKTLLILLVAFCSAAISASAQRRHGTMGDGDRSAQRREMVKRQAATLSQRMELDNATASWFEPLYIEYSDSLAAIRATTFPDRDKKIDELSDTDAEQLILDKFSGEEKTVAVKRAFYARFKERLTPQQLIRIFAQQPGSGQRGQQQGGPRGGFGGPEGHGGFGGPGFGPGPGGFGGPGF